MRIARPHELDELERLIGLGGPWLQARSHTAPDGLGGSLPVHAIAMGTDAPDAPALGLFGGVHGLEHIGARVVLAFLRSLVSRLPWDHSLHQLLAATRLVFMPVVNPAGLLRGTRANASGVDLMRNAPVQAQERPLPLVGGHRLSAALPWYRGPAGAPMQPESEALCEVVERELLGRPFALALDCHSGFGMRDRLWFPFAHTRKPLAHLAQVNALRTVFEGSHSHHPYVIEPQSAQYLTHGDLWDHLYLRAGQRAGSVFIPFTLEMGSWLWVKKNPRQLLSRGGMFNPGIEHREQRVLRRHLPLLDFLLRATASSARWLPQGDAIEQHRREGMARWWPGLRP